MSNVKADSINYVLNGQKSSKEEVKAIDPERIKSVELLNAKTAKEFYPELDNNRQVMFVTTADSEAGKKLKEKIDEAVGDGTLVRAKNMSINGSPDIATGSSVGTTMSYTVARSSDNTTEVEEEANSSKTINAVVVTGVSPAVKAKTMTTVKNHVYVTAKPSTDVLITKDTAPEVVTVQGFEKPITIDGKPRKIYVSKFNTNNDQLTIDGEGQPLFIIDGKEAKSLKNISPSDIKSISVLKDGTAEKKYGEKGKNGVVEITTKKGK